MANKAAWIVLGVFGAIVLLVLGAVGSAVGTYNAFVSEDEAVKAQAKQVDVAYKRAFDLVPTLVQLTDSYMQNETAVIRDATALRSGFGPAQNTTNTSAKDDYIKSVSQFVLLVSGRTEAYPALKSNDLFLGTMDELVNSINKITAEKVRFNDKVQVFNTHVRRCCIPLLVASFTGFSGKTYTGYSDRPETEPFPSGAKFT